MNKQATRGIVLARVDYQEADRILTILTPDYGKLTLIAKGVRKIKSKLAGGIELFSISHISYIPGKKDIGTLVSTKLQTHYAHIAQDIDKTFACYDMLKLINKLTEHGTTAEYFELVKSVFEALNSPAISTQLAMVWLYVQLLQLNGHDIRLDADVNEQPLSAEATYSFSVEDMAFFAHPSGIYLGKHIKVLRLLARQPASAVARVGGAEECMPQLLSLTKQAIDFHLSN